MPAWVRTHNPARFSTAVPLALAAAVLLLFALPSPATVYNSKNPNNPDNKQSPWNEDLSREVRIIERLNSTVPMDLEFIDEDGNKITLGKLFKQDRPVIFNLGYSRCPSICPQMRMNLVGALPKINKKLGEDFIVLNISIDPEETPEQSTRTRDLTFDQLEEAGVDAPKDGWRFLTADEKTIKKLAQALGYGYLYITPQDEYGHPSVLVLADGGGKIRRYMNGMNYSASALNLSIVETSDGKVGSLLENAFLTCFAWNPDANNYSATAKFIMMIGGGVIMVLVAGLVLFGLAYEKRRKQLAQAASDNNNDNGPDQGLPAGGQPGPA